jgi:hypothetical protein
VGGDCFDCKKANKFKDMITFKEIKLVHDPNHTLCKNKTPYTKGNVIGKIRDKGG